MDLAYLQKMPLAEFQARRERVLAQMAENSAWVIFTENEKRRNRDCDYLFRPDSDFWYLTGFAEPQAALLLLKKQGVGRSVLFLRERDPLKETWNGRRLGTEKAPDTLAVDEAYDIEQIDAVLAEKLQDLSACYYAEGGQPWGDVVMKQATSLSFQDWRPILAEMRLIKSELEVALIQQACQISAFGHLRAMKQTRPNRYEWEIEGEIQYEYSRFGARFPAYNHIVAGGENACILHYNENNATLKAGELLLIDSGAEFDYYAGDITRTIPISGRFNEAQRDIYQLVLEAQKAAIKLLTPNSSIKQANDKVVAILVEGLVKLGILQGSVHELIAQNAHKRFYMHGLGHWLGLDVHDVGDYGEERDRKLEIGMVLTVEPGLYLGVEEDIPEKYRGIGVRIEDNVLITEYGNKILTGAAPKEIADIEAIMAEEG